MNSDSTIVLVAFLNFIYLAFAVLWFASMWRLYEKAGQPGWAAIVPIYNLVVFMRVIGKPWWWFLLWFVPGIGIIWFIWSWNLMVKSFGKSEGYTVGCLLLPFVFVPILAFGDSEYIGPAGQGSGQTQFTTERDGQ